jgi:hypothetical protein
VGGSLRAALVPWREPLFRWRRKYWSFLLKLAPDKPSPTIQAQPGPYTGPFHWENRPGAKHQQAWT